MTTIETLAQAQALPIGTVLRLSSGRVADHSAFGGWQVTGVYSHHDYAHPRGLYDEDLPATVLHDPTQPSPASVIDRETIARVLAGFEGEAWVYDPPILDGVTRESSTPEMYLQRADAVLAALNTRTVAQVKAEALREWIATWPTTPDDGTFLADVARDGRTRADELEREDKR